MLSIFVVPPTARLHQGCWLCFIRVLPGLVPAPPGVRVGSGPLARSRLRALFTTGLFVANACLSCLVLGRSLQLRSWACCQMPPIVLHTFTSWHQGCILSPAPALAPCRSHVLAISPIIWVSGLVVFPGICSTLAFCLLVLFVLR